MQAMLEHVITQIAAGDPILSNSIGCDLKESVVAEGLGVIQGQNPDVEIGSYPSFRGGVLNVSVVVKGTDADAVKAASLAVMEHIEACGGEVGVTSFQVPVD